MMICKECKAQALRIAELERQVGELKDRLLRCLAEEENTRRRVIRALNAEG